MFRNLIYISENYSKWWLFALTRASLIKRTTARQKNTATTKRKIWNRKGNSSRKKSGEQCKNTNGQCAKKWGLDCHSSSPQAERTSHSTATKHNGSSEKTTGKSVKIGEKRKITIPDFFATKKTIN